MMRKGRRAEGRWEDWTRRRSEWMRVARVEKMATKKDAAMTVPKDGPVARAAGRELARVSGRPVMVTRREEREKETDRSKPS